MLCLHLSIPCFYLHLHFPSLAFFLKLPGNGKEPLFWPFAFSYLPSVYFLDFKMKPFDFSSVRSDSRCRTCLCALFVLASLIYGAYFITSPFISKQYIAARLSSWEVINIMQNPKSNICKNQCKPPGSEALPRGIVEKTSNLDLQPLWSYNLKKGNKKPSLSLLAMAVGVKQKQVVNKIVKKFPSSDFAVMLFHYDGIVDEWKDDFEWSNDAIHVSAVNQTKWWFAKRFLHPDIVAEYNYIFLWDEDLGVGHFDPRRYIAIVKDEGLEISQPALDPGKSEVHHQITARKKNSRVHRRMYKFRGSGRCDGHSTAPPCIGWVEMMAPVFSKAAWRCAWYMIQNDLIHAWGLDMRLGYCAQGDRMKNVGVVDSEYIIHLGLPTLGAMSSNTAELGRSQKRSLSNAEASAPSEARQVDNRPEVRRQSFIEMQTFHKRWENAVKEDKCWTDPYARSSNGSSG